MLSDKLKTMVGFGGEQGRINRIRDFVMNQLKPQTRTELLNIIRMFPYDAAKSEENLIIDYITSSNDDFFNMYRMKNNLEKGMLEVKEREEQARRENYEAIIDTEAKSYISHMIHLILDDDPRSIKYPSKIHMLANAVRHRVAELIEKIDGPYASTMAGTYT
jgi:hypothetical protein